MCNRTSPEVLFIRIPTKTVQVRRVPWRSDNPAKIPSLLRGSNGTQVPTKPHRNRLTKATDPHIMIMLSDELEIEMIAIFVLFAVLVVWGVLAHGTVTTLG